MVPDESPDEIKVLVTGFGPFREEYPRNPSSLIAHSMPSTIVIPTTGTSNTLSKGHEPSPRTLTIRLIPYPEPIHVSFLTVRKLIPAIYSSPSSPSYDPSYAQCSYILHIGMSNNANEYRVERQGHRDGYDVNAKKGTPTLDVDGRTLKECEEEMGLAEGEYWRGCPEIVQSTLDVDDIVERMHRSGARKGEKGLPEGISVRASDNAGFYLCDFIYYSSLSHFWRKNWERGERPVVFLHVPPESDEDVLDKGRKVALALIKAMVMTGRC